MTELSKKLRKLFKHAGRDIVAMKPEDWLEGREYRASLVRERAEDGMVAMVTSGMDCDCHSWANAVTMVPAIPRLVEKWIDDFHADAEGPQEAWIMRPSEAVKLECTHRDLALEAFEDGHPHYVVY